ncbi:hypothetical protein MBLNU459_g1251t1 [Dothideomycetes sp. NU459]
MAEPPGVRFSTNNQEISPETSLEPVRSLVGADEDDRALGPEAEEEIRQLKSTLQSGLQSKRMEHYNFEPVSLPSSQPVSRVPSGVNTPKRMPAGSAAPSPRHSPPQSGVNSPPLTPITSKTRDTKPATSTVASIAQLQKARAAADVVTPQLTAGTTRPASSPAVSDADAAVSAHPKQTPRFSIGPGGDSVPPSRDPSPSASGTTTPTGSGSLTPSSASQYNKAWPSGDRDDPYARSKRQPPTRNVDSIDARFRFGNREPRQGFSNSGTSLVTLPRAASSTTTATLKATEPEKRHSFFGNKKSDSHEDMTKDKDKAASKGNLKRFFKFGESKHKEKRSHSPVRSGSSTPTQAVPFADDHGLQSKYGKFGKILGSGAGGSVRLMKRTADGKTFAVKQFRQRHAYENEREYNKKVTAEFCIGSTLHHGNIIETIDIIHEKGNWFEVMEYAPFDLFAIVMTGKMARDEITCCTLQILSGVTYLHSMGLAHRDLKLDNVVVNEHGIMKIIDFGSAVVFKYPFENDIVLSTGVVGSDPYLAPEVYDNSRYDPQPADVWSIAIIFCCMCLRRFPWKAPRLSDNSYRLFVSTPDPSQDAMMSHSRRSSHNPSVDSGVPSTPAAENAPSNGSSSQQQQIKGPLRLLRLLPRDTRLIIGRMLDLDPRKRATVDEILADPWVQNAYVCRQEEGGQCYHAPGHTHVLEPGGQAAGGGKK